MIRYRVTIQGSKVGSIGTKYCERHHMTLWAMDRDDLNKVAIEAGHNEGLEHVLVTRVVEAWAE